MRLRCALLALTLAATAGGTPEGSWAAQLNSLQIGLWQGGAFANDQTRQFTHCAAGASYKSGIFLSVGIDRADRWSLLFADPSWHLTVGQHIPVTISFDDGIPWSGTAFVSSETRVFVPMAANSALISAFRAGLVMKVTTSGAAASFNLTATSALMTKLGQCVQTQLAIERGEPPPNFASSRPPGGSNQTC
jgi:hypothetical protein